MSHSIDTSRLAELGWKLVFLVHSEADILIARVVKFEGNKLPT